MDNRLYDIYKYTDKDEKFDIKIHFKNETYDEYKNVLFYRFQTNEGTPSSYIVVENNGDRYEYFPINIKKIQSKELNPIRRYDKLSITLITDDKMEFQNVTVEGINTDNNPRYIIKIEDGELESSYVIPTCNIAKMDVEYAEL